MPRRRPGTLVPLEREILRAAVDREGERFHGFGLAEAMRGDEGRSLIGHGTLYKALGRLQEAGLLTTVREDPESAHAERRPRRKLYAVTAAGAAALRFAERQAPVIRTAPRPEPA